MDHDCAFLIDAPRTLSDGGDAAESWVQIAKTGRFKDPRYGTFSITQQDFTRWLKNFQSLSVDKDRLGLPVDRDHSPEKKGDTEAVGWVKALDQRGDEMWGKVEWNTLGKELVSEKRYAYISPSYSKDLQTETGTSVGTALVGIALTNRPFLQMATVNLSKFSFVTNLDDSDSTLDDSTTDLDDTALDWQDGDEDDKTAAGVLGPHVLDVTEPERQAHAVVVKKVNGKTRHMFPIPPGDKLHARLAKAFIPAAQKAGHITEAEAGSVKKRADDVLSGDKSTRQHGSYSHRQMELNTVLTAFGVTLSELGLDDKADEATVLSKLHEHQAKPAEPTPGVVSLSAEQVTQLIADANAGKAAAEELQLSKFTTAFDAAQRDGKVTLSQKGTFKALYDAKPDDTIKLMGDLQPSINMRPAGTGQEPMDLSAESAQLATEFQDSVTPYGIDTEALRLHATAVKLEQDRKIPYEQALLLAESGVGA